MATAWEKWLRRHHPGLNVPEHEVVPSFGPYLGRPLPLNDTPELLCENCRSRPPKFKRRPARHSLIYCPLCHRSGFDVELRMQLELAGLPTKPIAEPPAAVIEATDDVGATLDDANDTSPLRPEWACEGWDPHAITEPEPEPVQAQDTTEDTASKAVAAPCRPDSMPSPGPAFTLSPAPPPPRNGRPKAAPRRPGPKGSPNATRLTLGQSRPEAAKKRDASGRPLRGGLDP